MLRFFKKYVPANAMPEPPSSASRPIMFVVSPVFGLSVFLTGVSGVDGFSGSSGAGVSGFSFTDTVCPLSVVSLCSVTFFGSSGSVSYTHLDVYKRQRHTSKTSLLRSNRKLTARSVCDCDYLFMPTYIIT